MSRKHLSAGCVWRPKRGSSATTPVVVVHPFPQDRRARVADPENAREMLSLDELKRRYVYVGQASRMGFGLTEADVIESVMSEHRAAVSARRAA